MVNKIAVLIIAVGAVGFSFFVAGLYGVIVCAAVIAGYMWAMRGVYRDFEGISGDLLGYALVISELFGLIALALLQGVTLWS
jgi:adenosylcobinamide-GDP ribazoletransferase